MWHSRSAFHAEMDGCHANGDGFKLPKVLETGDSGGPVNTGGNGKLQGVIGLSKNKPVKRGLGFGAKSDKGVLTEEGGV